MHSMLLRGGSLAFALLLTFIASSAQAVIIKGDGGDANCIALANCPYVFDNAAFADFIVGVGNVANPAGAAGSDLSTFATLNTPGVGDPPNSIISVNFIDNTVINGPGADIVIFELLAPTGYGIQVGNILIPFVFGTSAGPMDGINQNTFDLDLSLLGLAPGDHIHSLLIIDVSAGTPRISGVAALNSGPPIPEPATALLLGGALMVVAARRARR